MFEGNIKNSLFHLFKYAKDDIIHKVAENGYRNIARNLKNVSDDEFTGFSLGQQDVPLDLFGRQNFSEHNRHEYARL